MPESNGSLCTTKLKTRMPPELHWRLCSAIRSSPGFGSIELYACCSLVFTSKSTFRILKWLTAENLLQRQPLIVLSMMCTKVLICLFLLRIFSIKRAWRWIIWSIMAFSIITNVPSACVILAQCSPVEKLWNPLLTGNCWPKGTQVAIGEYHGGRVPESLEYA